MPEVRMSLKEAGNLLGLKPNSVRSRYKKGQIRGEADNMGKIWVYLDPSKDTPSKVMIEPGSNNSTEPAFSGEIRALQAHVDVLTEQLAKADAELTVLRPLASENARLVAEGEGLRAQIAVVDRVNAEKVEMLDKLMALLVEQREKPRRWWPFG